MRNLLAMALALALAACTATSQEASLMSAAPPGSPVAEHGALAVRGGKVVGSDGQPVALHGMALFWSQ